MEYESKSTENNYFYRIHTILNNSEVTDSKLRDKIRNN